MKKLLILTAVLIVRVWAIYDAWGVSNRVQIVNTTGSTLTDMPVKINIDGDIISFASFKADGTDIRFSQGGVGLSNWIESWDPAEETGIVWVKVPTIPSGTNTNMFFHFQNPAAPSVSDGDAVFWYHADFEGAAALGDENLNKTGGTWTFPTENGNTYLSCAESYQSVYTTAQFTNFIFRAKMRGTNIGSSEWASPTLYFRMQNNSTNYRLRHRLGSTALVTLYRGAETWLGGAVDTGADPEKWNEIVITANGSSFSFSVGSASFTRSDTNIAYGSIGCYNPTQVSENGESHFDNLMVYQYVSAEPEATLAVNAALVSSISNSVVVSPNYAINNSSRLVTLAVQNSTLNSAFSYSLRSGTTLVAGTFAGKTNDTIYLGFNLYNVPEGSYDLVVTDINSGEVVFEDALVVANLQRAVGNPQVPLVARRGESESVTIAYDYNIISAESRQVTISIYSITGVLVRILFDGLESFGHSTHDWDYLDNKGESVPMGAYLVTIAIDADKNIRETYLLCVTD